MGRKWGATAARKAIRNIARTKRIPQGKVTVEMISGRVSSRQRQLGKAAPGQKVTARYFDSVNPMGVEQMLKKMKRLSKDRMPRGFTRRGH